jgi:hypothetical protein
MGNTIDEGAVCTGIYYFQTPEIRFKAIDPLSSSAYTAALVGSVDEPFGRYAGSVSYQI